MAAELPVTFHLLVGDLLDAARQEDRRACAGLQDQADNTQVQRRVPGQVVDARQSAQESGERRNLHRNRPFEQHAGQAIGVKLKRPGAGVRLPGRFGNSPEASRAPLPWGV